jgi:hypothetical protein
MSERVEGNRSSQSQPCDAGPHPREDFDAQPSAARKCLTPGCNYAISIRARTLTVSVAIPQTDARGRLLQLSGLLGHLTIPERGLPSRRGELAALYEDVLHDAMERPVAAILCANAAYESAVGHIGNPDGPMRDAAYDAAREALLKSIEAQSPQSEAKPSAGTPATDEPLPSSHLPDLLREVVEALKPFAAITPSSLYADDGSEAERYVVRLYDGSRHEPPHDFTGADLAKLRAALSHAQEIMGDDR